MDASTLIDRLGGSAAVAEQMGIGQFAVGNWRKRGIPAWAIQGMRGLCAREGIDPGELLEPRPPRNAKERVS